MPPRGDESGLRCPTCGTAMRVSETRAASGGRALRRRRVCPGCGTRQTTLELVVAPYDRNDVEDLALVRQSDLSRLRQDIEVLADRRRRLPARSRRQLKDAAGAASGNEIPGLRVTEDTREVGDHG